MAQVETLERSPSGRAYLPQPEPGLTPETVLERARALRPKLRERQEESDELGWYGEEIHQELLAGGFYRLVQPRMFGGYEFALPDFIKVVIEIARGHPSSGWCYCLGTSHAAIVASHFPEEVQRELFGPNGDLRAPHRAAPAGEFKRADGGWIVNGTWNYSSGAPMCTHFMGGTIIREEGKPPRGADFIIAREQIEIIPDWGGDRSLGMRGSGSQSVKVTNQFVPDKHVVPSVLLTLPDWKNGTPGVHLHQNPLYLGIFGGVYHATFTAILAGTAYAACDEFEEIIRVKKTMGGQLKLNEPASQSALGEALAKAQSAEALALWVTNEYLAMGRRWMKTGQPITPEDTLRIWSVAQKGCYLACDAVEGLFRVASASSSHKGQKMQRYFRDIQMYLVHPSAQPIVTQLYAQNHLGLSVGLPGTAP
jgi:3-hydroxy-9,10-secoandrosta-1,3,5(10)-triene-9,17-dione monooxygenase